MRKKLAWGILGTGGIAGTFAGGVATSRLGRLVAVGSRKREKADAFADKWGIPNRHGSYESLLADPEVEAVYIATPHPMHAEWSIKAAEAGKHILCEKPLALNYAEAMVVVEAARENDVFLMEAFMYRCHPQTAKLVKLVREKAVGEVLMIQACFSFQASYDPQSRLFVNALGGGGILDVGCYPVSMSRLLAGAAQGLDFAEPIAVRGAGRIGDKSRVDECAAAVLKFPGDIVAQVSTGISVQQENVVRVFGTEGRIIVPDPWMPRGEGGKVKIIVEVWGKEPREIAVEAPHLYGNEADVVAGSIGRRQASPPAMTWKDTLGNMKALDAWRDEIGMVYDSEKLEAGPLPVRRRAPVPRAKNNMKYGKIAGVEKNVSRIAMGSMCVDLNRAVHFSALFDDYFERGGNFFDTAYVYGGGMSEKGLGHWIKTRGLREQVAILAKGAHTPDCYPEAIVKQLSITLERLQTDYVDIYMMHRDNMDVPVGEFVDVLNEQKKAGRVHAFGGSNWTIERVEAFRDYALKKGLIPFSAVSNNFSLARAVETPWEGCIHSSDRKSREWFEKTQMPLVSWSSQAQGFFARGDPSRRDEEMLVRCWYSEDNFRRLDRAREMGKKRGVGPTVIALAYVLGQSFPTFPLIGALEVSETASCMKALDVELTPAECRWLDLEAD